MAKRGPAGDVPLAGVIGHPVSHSLSPRIFQYLGEKLQLPVHYRRIDVTPEGLRGFFTAAREVGLFTGWNVTIPHKEAVAGLVDRLSPEAEATGAVNVVHFMDGQALGFNTDVFGIQQTLLEQGFKARGSSVVIYGAGGAASAVAVALARAGASEIRIANRTLARARKSVAALNKRKLGRKGLFEAIDLKRARAVASTADLHVNATPLGMKGFPPNELLPETAAPGALAFDLIYRPADTGFLKAASRQNLQTVGGLDMLLWQAIATWEIWFGQIPGGPAKRLALKRGLRRTLSVC